MVRKNLTGYAGYKHQTVKQEPRIREHKENKPKPRINADVRRYICAKVGAFRKCGTHRRFLNDSARCARLQGLRRVRDQTSKSLGLNPEENQSRNREKDAGCTNTGPAGESPGLRAEQRAERTA